MTIPPHLIPILIQAATTIIVKLIEANGFKFNNKHKQDYPHYQRNYTDPIGFAVNRETPDQIRLCLWYQNLVGRKQYNQTFKVDEVQTLAPQIHQWVADALTLLFDEMHEVLTGEDVIVPDLEVPDQMTKYQQLVAAYELLENEKYLQLLDPDTNPVFPPTVGLMCEIIRANALIIQNLHHNLEAALERIEELENQLDPL